MKAARIALACLGVAAMSAFATAADKPKAKDEAGRFYFPNLGESGTRTILPDGEIIRRPVVYSISAEILEATRLQTSEGSTEIAAGTMLPAVLVTNLPNENREVFAYCTPVVKAKPSTTRLMLGVLGAQLVKSLTDGRKCLFDKDGDGMAEYGFLIDDGAPADRTPQRIAPVKLAIAANRQAGPGDYVLIRLRRASRPSFVIDIFENGKQVAFNTITADGQIEAKRQTIAKDSTFPSDYEIYGAKFRILKFDKSTGAITIEWLPDHQDEMRGVPSKVIYTYRYY